MNLNRDNHEILGFEDERARVKFYGDFRAIMLNNWTACELAYLPSVVQHPSYPTDDEWRATTDKLKGSQGPNADNYNMGDEHGHA